MSMSATSMTQETFPTTISHTTTMSTNTSSRPLTRESIVAAHELIKPHIHHTPVLTNTTLSNLASTPQTPESLIGTQWEGQTPARPKFRLFFKCENFQRIGAFKVRGAFHAVLRLIEDHGLEEVRKKGVVTHSSGTSTSPSFSIHTQEPNKPLGNHAQALALAARTFAIPAHIVMPSISTPSKIAGTRAQAATLYFSGSTAPEREAVVADIVRDTGATLVPPYNHTDIILGQGTMAIEAQSQVAALLAANNDAGVADKAGLDALVAPCGGGGMLAGNAVALHATGIRVFGAEPSFQGADDARRGVAAGHRVDTVKTLTIADGLRTPLGELTWRVVSDPAYVRGLYAVTEANIRDAMRLVLERMKCFVEPSAVVGLATALYNEDFRRLVEAEAGPEGWNLGLVLSGGNTTVEAIMQIFAGADDDEAKERAGGVLGLDGSRDVENVAG
jgi:threonine dehydratase